jgi:hypothetical protein
MVGSFCAALVCTAGCAPAPDPSSEQPIPLASGEYIIERKVASKLTGDERYGFATSTAGLACAKIPGDESWLEQAMLKSVIEQSSCTGYAYQRTGNKITGRALCPIYLNPGLYEATFEYSGTVSKEGVKLKATLARPNIGELGDMSRGQREQLAAREARRTPPIQFDYEIRLEREKCGFSASDGD